MTTITITEQQVAVSVSASAVTLTIAPVSVSVSVAPGATSFLGLSDTPDAYAGQGLKTVTVNAGATGLEFTTASGGVTDHGALTGLADDDHAQYHTDARGDLRYPPLVRTLTINGTALDLSANRAWTVGDALLAAANIFTLGPNLFRAGADANVALAARRHSSGATANIFEVQDQTGVAVASVSPTGVGTFNQLAVTDYGIYYPIYNQPTIPAYASLVAATTFNKAISQSGLTVDIFNGAFVQILDIQTAPVAAFIAANGLYVQVVTPATALYNANQILASQFILDHYSIVTNVTPNIGAASYTSTGRGSSAVGTNTGISVSATSVSASSANYSEITGINVFSLHRGASGTAINRYGIRINADTGAGTTTNSYQLRIESVLAGAATTKYSIYAAGGQNRFLAGAAGIVPLVLQLAASPTGDAFEIVASDGTTKLSYFDKDGDLFLPTKTANTIYAGPTSGGAARPAFRALVAADIPSLSSIYQPLAANLTAIAALADPNADRILFWDDSAGAYAYLTAGTGLTITGTTIDASGGGGTIDGSGTAGQVAQWSDSDTLFGSAGLLYDDTAKRLSIVNSGGTAELRVTGTTGGQSLLTFYAGGTEKWEFFRQGTTHGFGIYDATNGVISMEIDPSTKTMNLHNVAGVGYVLALGSTGAATRRATLNTTASAAMYEHNAVASTGTPTDGFGAAWEYNMQDDSSTNVAAMEFNLRWAEAAHGTRKARAQWYILDTDYREALRLEASGSAPMIGFLGANAAVRQTGGAATAGGTYGATEQTMLQRAYDALRTFGLIS